LLFIGTLGCGGGALKYVVCTGDGHGRAPACEPVRGFTIPSKAQREVATLAAAARSRQPFD